MEILLLHLRIGSGALNDLSWNKIKKMSRNDLRCPLSR